MGKLLVERHEKLEAELLVERQHKASASDELAALWQRHTELVRLNEKLREANVGLHLSTLETACDDGSGSGGRVRGYGGGGGRRSASLPPPPLWEDIQGESTATRAMREALEEQRLEAAAHERLLRQLLKSGGRWPAEGGDDAAIDPMRRIEELKRAAELEEGMAALQRTIAAQTAALAAKGRAVDTMRAQLAAHAAEREALRAHARDAAVRAAARGELNARIVQCEERCHAARTRVAWLRWRFGGGGAGGDGGSDDSAAAVEAAERMLELLRQEAAQMAGDHDEPCDGDPGADASGSAGASAGDGHWAWERVRRWRRSGGGRTLPRPLSAEPEGPVSTSAAPRAWWCAPLLMSVCAGEGEPGNDGDEAVLMSVGGAEGGWDDATLGGAKLPHGDTKHRAEEAATVSAATLTAPALRPFLSPPRPVLH